MPSEEQESILIYFLRDLAPNLTSASSIHLPQPHLRPGLCQMYSVGEKTTKAEDEDLGTHKLYPDSHPFSVPQGLARSTLWSTRVFGIF